MSATLRQLALSVSDPNKNPDLVSLCQPVALERMEEQEAVFQARRIGGGSVSALLFRRFSDGRASQVAAYVIDNESGQWSDEQIAAIHHKVWLHGEVPLLYVDGRTEVALFSCMGRPTFWQGGRAVYCPAETLREGLEDAAKIARYSANRLCDGSFWQDEETGRLADSDQAAHQRLVRKITEADRALLGAQKPWVRRLLLLTILVKYLEDRKVFPRGWFARCLPGATSFLDILQTGDTSSLLRLFEKLEKKFNGGIFAFAQEAERLTQADMRQLSELVEGRTENGQPEFWALYSFEYIPVEVISAIYEEFADRKRGAVFTPPLAVRLLLDFALPYSDLRGDERILDPTCGSGVFLVSAYKRLVLIWKKTHNWRKPTVEDLKRILGHSICGIEINPEAAQLTSFSLALALCDALQPHVIWSKLRFDKLEGCNILCDSVFDVWKKGVWKNEFDVVIGNPPFMPIADAAFAKGTPSRETAYWILRRSFDFVRDNGRLCLIQPHGILYNSTCRSFAARLFAERTLETVFDFISIPKLFNANVTTLAVLCTKAVPEATHQALHVIFRKTVAVEKRLCFETDHYDVHEVEQSRIAGCPWIWRVNLLGGGRLADLCERLIAMPTMKLFLSRSGWVAAEGYKAGAEKSQRAPCASLAELSFLPTEALGENGIDWQRITKVPEKEFERPRNEELFTAPLIVIRKHVSLPCDFIDKGKMAYKDQVVGIYKKKKSGRKDPKDGLYAFYQRLHTWRPLLQKIGYVMGTRSITIRATAIGKKDILALPWPEKDFKFCPWEQTLLDDLENGMVDLTLRGARSRLLRQFVSDKDMRSYRRVFTDLLTGIYPNLRFGRWGTFDGFAYCAFWFGEETELDWPDAAWSADVASLVYKQYGDALQTVRVLRIYRKNTVLIVKPKALRYWIRSTAIRDADDVFGDLREQGY